MSPEDTGPEFTIRATDPLAVHGLISYARVLEQNDHTAMADKAFNTAMEIAVWQRNWPERVNITTTKEKADG